MIAYRGSFAPDADGITVRFPDFPEAVTCGYTEAQAREYTRDALLTVLTEYVRRRREIPRPRKATKGMLMIPLPALAEAKLRVYQAMRDGGLRKADLVRRLGWQKSQVDRLLDLEHASRLDQIKDALAVLNKRLAIVVEDAPAPSRTAA